MPHASIAPDGAPMGATSEKRDQLTLRQLTWLR